MRWQHKGIATREKHHNSPLLKAKASFGTEHTAGQQLNKETSHKQGMTNVMASKRTLNKYEHKTKQINVSTSQHSLGSSRQSQPKQIANSLSRKQNKRVKIYSLHEASSTSSSSLDESKSSWTTSKPASCLYFSTRAPAPIPSNTAVSTHESSSSPWSFQCTK